MDKHMRSLGAAASTFKTAKTHLRTMLRMAAFALTMVLAPHALATFHLFRIDQVYSSADRTIQFVVLVESTGANDEDHRAGHELTSRPGNEASRTCVFPTNLPNRVTNFAGQSASVTAAQANAGAGARNYEGLWRNAPGASENGLGVNFTHQGDTIFATSFTYGADTAQADFYDLGTYRDEDLLTRVTTNEVPAAPVELPSTLRHIADLGPVEARQRVQFDEVRDLCTAKGASIAFLINGRIFDMDRIDLVSVAGRVEEWDIFNNTAMPHPFHIHGTQFQVMSHRLDGDPTPAPYRAWVDRVLVPVAQTVTIKVRQELPGKRMFHCHILQHEDNCMMAILDAQRAAG